MWGWFGGRGTGHKLYFFFLLAVLLGTHGCAADFNQHTRHFRVHTSEFTCFSPSLVPGKSVSWRKNHASCNQLPQWSPLSSSSALYLLLSSSLTKRTPGRADFSAISLAKVQNAQQATSENEERSVPEALDTEASAQGNVATVVNDAVVSDEAAPSAPEATATAAAAAAGSAEAEASIVLYGQALFEANRRDVGRFELVAGESVSDRPVYRNKQSDTYMYWVEGSWVVGKHAGSMEGVSFFVDDPSADPLGIREPWVEGFNGEWQLNADLSTRPLSQLSQAELLEYAASREQSMLQVLERREQMQGENSEAGGSRQMFSPIEVTIGEELAGLREMVKGRGKYFGDNEWKEANRRYNRVMMDLFLGLGKAKAGFLTDPRLPPEHAAALVVMDQVALHAKKHDKELFTVLKFVQKKEGVPPLAKRVTRDNVVPIYDSRRSLIKACQSIERALSETLTVAITNALLSQQKDKALDYPAARSDFLKSARHVAEHTHVNDKHPLLLLLARAFFTPGPPPLRAYSRIRWY